MTADNQKSTVLFVHGAWHTNEAFAQIQGLLSQAGYGIKNLQLPSSAPNGPWVQGISEEQRREKNLKGGIVHLVYISAVVIDEGVSLKDGLGGDVAPWAIIHVCSPSKDEPFH